MTKAGIATAALALTAFIALPAKAQIHSHPVLNGIECIEEITTGTIKDSTCTAVVTPNDGQFVRFVNPGHHLALNFGKTSGNGDCVWVGARVDTPGYPALHWELNLGPTSNSEVFLTKVLLSNGQTAWYKGASFFIHDNELIASFNGADVGLTGHDTFLAIYVVENGAKTNDEILAVAVDGIVGTNNTSQVPETDCGFKHQVECSFCKY